MINNAAYDEITLQIPKGTKERIADNGVDDINEFIKSAIEDKLDDMFCERLYQEYINDPDPTKDEAISIEEFAKELGVAI